MQSIYAATKRSALAEIFRSGAAYWAGLLVIWELFVIVAAWWLVPTILSAAGSSGALPSDIGIVGVGG